MSDFGGAADAALDARAADSFARLVVKRFSVANQRVKRFDAANRFRGFGAGAKFRAARTRVVALAVRVFFLWTLWNNLFSEFDARRLLRSLAVLFGTAFLLKHLILAAFAAPETSIWRRITGLILEGVSLGSLDVPNFAPMTGYISFFALVLYVVGLVGLLPAAKHSSVHEKKIIDEDRWRLLSAEIAQLSSHEQELLRQQLIRKQIDGEAIVIETTNGE